MPDPYLGLFEMDSENADDLASVTEAIARLRASNPEATDADIAAVALAAMAAQRRVAGEVQEWVSVRAGLDDEEYRELALSLAGHRLHVLILKDAVALITRIRREAEQEMKSERGRDTLALIAASERAAALRLAEVALRDHRP